MAPETMALEQRPRENFPPARSSGPGLTARELVRRHRRPNTQLSPGDLEDWLTSSGLAEVDEDGQLRPTRVALEIAVALTTVD